MKDDNMSNDTTRKNEALELVREKCKNCKLLKPETITVISKNRKISKIIESLDGEVTDKAIYDAIRRSAISLLEGKRSLTPDFHRLLTLVSKDVTGDKQNWIEGLEEYVGTQIWGGSEYAFLINKSSAYARSIKCWLMVPEFVSELDYMKANNITIEDSSIFPIMQRIYFEKSESKDRLFHPDLARKALKSIAKTLYGSTDEWNKQH